jgi:hypothetical protein
VKGDDLPQIYPRKLAPVLCGDARHIRPYRFLM